jgi:hypothetical protein
MDPKPVSNPIEQELKSHADYLKGMADAFYMAENVDAAKRLALCSKWLEKTSTKTCRQGFVGCRGGATCTSSHK